MFLLDNPENGTLQRVAVVRSESNLLINLYAVSLSLLWDLGLDGSAYWDDCHMVLERVVSYVGDSVSERTVASIFRLKLPCIVLVDVMFL